MHANSAAMTILPTLGLFTLTGFVEIAGCWLILQGTAGRWSWWWCAPAAAAALAVFAWLLTCHEMASGRVYAAYGGVYVLASLGWLAVVDQVRPTLWDYAGVALCVAGTVLICLQPQAGVATPS